MVSPRGYIESVARAGGWPALVDPVGDPDGLLDRLAAYRPPAIEKWLDRDTT
jgi:hypothetical protein